MPRRSSRQLWKDKIEGKPVSGGLGNRYSAARLPFRGTILGIDPSLRGTGLAVLEFEKRDRPVLLHSRTIKLKPAISMFDCLGRINGNVAEILDAYRIDVVAVEQTIYVQNFQTAQILGAARGAAIAAAAILGIRPATREASRCWSGEGKQGASCPNSNVFGRFGSCARVRRV
jgi:crossover junction endodeoxyribonuclease RuvC